MRIMIGLCAITALLPAQPVKVGEHVPYVIQSTHPYHMADADDSEPVLMMREFVHFPNATYIAIHFAKFDLAPGDVVVIKSLDGAHEREYRGQGRQGLGKPNAGFFATHVKGDLAVLEFYVVPGHQGYGFDVDYIGRGYADDEIQMFWDLGLGREMNLPEPQGEHRSVCTTDDTREVKCYQVSEPQAYDKAQAVARLLINGESHCTGWLLGCEGHVMTNQHCIDSQDELNNIDFEFLAEGATCATNCATPLACPGVIEASGGIFVQADIALDFALVIPDTSTGSGTDLAATYGYLQMRESGPVLDERIYIPQHPSGWGKRIAFESTYPDDVSGFPTIVSSTEPGCSGAIADLGYWADTRSGSSGSPVLGYDDHFVVALHHCSGDLACATGGSGDDPNRGVSVLDIITELGDNLPECALCDPPNPPTALTSMAVMNNQIDLNWNPPAGGTDAYNVYRAIGNCTSPQWSLLAAAVATPNYSDTSVSGGTTYSYQVASYLTASNCESDLSNCSEVVATGDCTLAPPAPANLVVTNTQTSTCELVVSWDAVTQVCGSEVVYNVYRSQTMGFVPAMDNLIASGVSDLFYNDLEVNYAQSNFYIVRAEDDSGNGTGPHAGGNEDQNLNEVVGIATGSDSNLFTEDVESGDDGWIKVPGPNNVSPSTWGLFGGASHSPVTSWFVTDESLVKDQSLQMVNDVVLVDGNPHRLAFWHRVNTQFEHDGGVLEYSLDGGANWFDILAGDGLAVAANANRFLADGYNSVLSFISNNPLPNRSAWSGDNMDWQRCLVDISDFGGYSARFRWRFGCDEKTSGVGWNLDDIDIFFGSECFNTCDLPDNVSQWPQQTIIELVECVDNQMP